MSMSNTLENGLLALLLNGTTFDGIAENDTTSPATQFYISLHTADPGEAGNQTTSEATYTSYARVAVARSGSGWTVSGNTATLTSAVEFPTSTGGSNVITHIGIGTASTGTGTLLLSGTVSPNLTIASGQAPRLTTSSAITFD